MAEDKIFESALGDEPFRFNADVARVFPDMLRRSIPGYEASLEAIGSLAARYVTEGSQCYDLGCSLGAATIAMRQGIRAANCHIVAVDTAPAMVKRCRQIIADDDASNQSSTTVEVVEGDINDMTFENASMVVLNYTLQFLPVADRQTLLTRICDGMIPGGLLLLSEKVVDENEQMEELLIDLYHEHKRRNHYSALEIARKRAALEDVLIPETIATHRERLTSAGFSRSAVWLRYFNFVSIIALR